MSRLPNPGFGYIMEDDVRPGLVKIGLADDPEKRFNSLKTGNPGLKLTMTFPYFDKRRQDRQVLKHFKSKQFKREWHYADKDEVAAFVKLTNDEQRLLHGKNASIRGFAINTGLVELPANIPAAKLPALKWLLSQPCPTLPDLTIGQVIVQALRGAPDLTRKYARGLQQAGLELQTCDKAIVFDKRPKGLLAKVFARGEAAKTWRAQLSELAGLDAGLKPVKMERWLRTTMSQPSLQACVQA